MRWNVVLLRQERNRLGIGIAPLVGGSEGSVGGVGGSLHGSPLESLGRRMDLLILRTDLGQQQWPMLTDGRPGRSGQLSVDGVR
jgi:hypothetical protein